MSQTRRQVAPPKLEQVAVRLVRRGYSFGKIAGLCRTTADDVERYVASVDPALAKRATRNGKRKSPEIVCAQCQFGFTLTETRKSIWGKAKFCSQDCYHDHVGSTLTPLEKRIGPEIAKLRPQQSWATIAASFGMTRQRVSVVFQNWRSKQQLNRP